MQERRASAVGLVLAAACSVQGGAAVAKSLFPQLGPPGVVFLRLAFGSAALWAIARPELRGRARADLRLIAALGVVLVSMNITFYEALSRAPLGVVVTVEFLGPLAVAVIGSRRAVDLLWVVLAGAGVALLAENRGGSVHVTGIVLAATAGFFWALYILLGVRVGQKFAGASGLAPAMALGAVLMAPWGIYTAGHHLRDAQLVGAAVGVGSAVVGAALVARDRGATAAAAARLQRRALARAGSRCARRAALPARASARPRVDCDRARRAGERRCRGAPAPTHSVYAGLMFWFTLKTLPGSYCDLIRARRS